jgi:adenosylcobinamide kinase/adenosylcobinamide-phosphate guanylyltransferase
LSNIAVVSEVKNLSLITGGARSGKSIFAESIANQVGGTVLYIATMEEISHDHEGVERIRRHRERRPQHWQTVETAFNVDEEVIKMPAEVSVCLIDCLSLYVSNMLLALDLKTDAIEEIEQSINEATGKLLTAIESRDAIQFIVVTNEVGWGIVPEHKLARSYRDLLGIVNQRFAQVAGQVWLSCSGLQIKLKPQAAVH